MYKRYDELDNKEIQNTDQYSVIEIPDAEYKMRLLRENKIVCVDIYADWCGPCKAISPDYASLANRYNSPGECILVKEHIDKNITTDISGIPTFLFYVNGNLVDKVVGADIDKVEEKLKIILSTPIVTEKKSYLFGPQAPANTIRRQNHRMF